ncbi:Sialidase [Aspergillus cavernicola]|uniref:Sialidase n=1 Tax=Aspergillus cavernicola TaxID=176166 RepID=A0ABR4IUW3_9EURO
MRLGIQVLPFIFSFVSSQVISSPQPEPFTDFTNYIIWNPAADALPDESLVITWENYPLEPPLVNHPIYRSVDGGSTWTNYSAVEDQVNDWGMRFQPNLYTLPEDFGGYAAGSILAAGVSTPFSLEGGVYIDLYVSEDKAATWTFVSHIVYGDGPETIQNGNDALWEPWLMLYNGQLVCFFSDQRDPAHSQKLVHVTSTDLQTWSDPVPDAVNSIQADRPGMTTIAHIESTDSYIMTYELCGAASCAVHYKVASSPLEFDSAPAIQLISNDTNPIQPRGSPYVVWTEHPDRTDGSGLIIASSASAEVVFVNEDAADPAGWKSVDVGMWSAYSRGMRIVTLQEKKKLFFTNGGNMGNPAYNSIACGVVEIPR